MSVVAAIIQPEHYAILACDGVATHPSNGSVVGYVSKITTLPEFDAVIGVTGLSGFELLLRWDMPLAASDFDDLVEAMPDMMRSACRRADEIWNNRGKCCAVIAGWSEARQKYEGWRITNYDKDVRLGGADATADFLPAFEMRQLTDRKMWASAGPGEDVLRKFGVIGGPDEDTDLDAVQRMVCAARADSGSTTEEDLRYNAGGFIQVAHLTKGYAQSMITHRWPEDVIGLPVDPSAGQPLPDRLMAHYNAQT